MVSNKLTSLAEHFAAWSREPRGVQLDQRVLLLLEAELRDAADQVRQLEHQPAGPQAGAGGRLRLVGGTAMQGHALGGAA
ncbi:hypothetical protein UFOVP99_7 [uncultured Caudovirales phage]|uniref:Uncharacterized protein n=1 Tax=uncultured Caudovirales phage TaxID=2100421 RepID=A0A6J5L449_9CAUD|nr:hypothetical protein UFOVP99_7 [uncultured Caudovirales phage]